MPKSAALSRRAAVGALVATGLGLSRATGASANRLVVGGTGSALGTMRRLIDAFRAGNPDLQCELPPSLGTTGGLRAVVAGAIDIAISVRPVNPEEAARGAKSVLYARSPFGFVTSLRDPPATLTTADILDIYALKRRTWPDGSPIRVILRTRRDGDSQFVIERFPAAEPVLEATHAKQILPVAQTDQANLDLAEKLEGSFASSTMAAVISEGRDLRGLAIDGVKPTCEAVAAGTYPHVRSLYFVTMPATSEAARAFIDFAMSTRGARILAECGNVPVTA
ncbi:MAG: substrate-binding domain-containing protein [Alphaproteobacteria bacterium]|nr:substrate-binding domain-containing protein [Alphaproteobacteria bacterium]